MPAAKPKTKRTAKKVRDNRLWREWGNDPDLDPAERTYMREHFFSRRHLATAIDPGGGRELRYIIERDEMDQATCDGLKRIYARDGKAIFEEVSRELLLGLLGSIDYVGGGLPRPWRRMMKELGAEIGKEDAREDARARQRVRRGELPAIAA